MSVRTVRLFAAGLAVATIAAGSAAAANAATYDAATDRVAVATADQALADRLTFSREEERMARDLYREFASAYPQAAPFAMIARSEQQHMDAVAGLLTTYGIPDPAAGKSAGSYSVPAIQQLYDGWHAQGLTSLAAAYQVGIDLEKRDIADLDATLADLHQTDVTTVLTRLRTASTHHEAAFTAASTGSTASHAPGQGMGQGMGPGQGQGMGQGQGQGAGCTGTPGEGAASGRQGMGARWGGAGQRGVAAPSAS